MRGSLLPLLGDTQDRAYSSDHRLQIPPGHTWCTDEQTTYLLPVRPLYTQASQTGTMDIWGGICLSSGPVLCIIGCYSIPDLCLLNDSSTPYPVWEITKKSFQTLSDVPPLGEKILSPQPPVSKVGSSSEDLVTLILNTCLQARVSPGWNTDQIRKKNKGPRGRFL